MTENINDQRERRKLDDAELDAVAGGKGDWSPWNEHAYRRRWAYDGPGISFEDWVRSRISDDSNKARDAWLANNSPQNLSFHYEDGRMWTEPYKE